MGRVPPLQGALERALSVWVGLVGLVGFPMVGSQARPAEVPLVLWEAPELRLAEAWLARAEEPEPCPTEVLLEPLAGWAVPDSPLAE